MKHTPGQGDVDPLGHVFKLREVHLEPGMYHGADAIFPGRTSMRRFRQRLDDALRAAIGTAAGADAEVVADADAPG